MKRLSYFAGIDADDKSIWKRLRRNVSISALGSALFVAIRLAQTVLLTRFLEIDDYGRVLIVLNLFVFLNSFFGLRVSDLMYRFFPPLKHEGDDRGLRYLLLFCFGSCLASGLLIYGVVLIISPWLAGHLYSHASLSTLFNIYGCTLLISAFSGVYEPILRIYDRFSAVVVPQILGSALTLLALLIYFATKPAGYDLKVVVTALAVGLLVQVIPPFVKALRLVRPLLVPVKVSAVTSEQTKYRREFFRCLFNSNLSGYLKFAIDPGDIFLLGVFSSPTQVALYGLAQRLVAPAHLLADHDSNRSCARNNDACRQASAATASTSRGTLRQAITRSGWTLVVGYTLARATATAAFLQRELLISAADFLLSGDCRVAIARPAGCLSRNFFHTKMLNARRRIAASAN